MKTQAKRKGKARMVTAWAYSFTDGDRTMIEVMPSRRHAINSRSFAKENGDVGPIIRIQLPAPAGEGK